MHGIAHGARAGHSEGHRRNSTNSQYTSTWLFAVSLTRNIAENLLKVLSKITSKKRRTPQTKVVRTDDCRMEDGIRSALIFLLNDNFYQRDAENTAHYGFCTHQAQVQLTQQSYDSG